MSRALHALGVLLSHWRRKPLQLVALLGGLMIATALWSGVQALNAQAREAYDRAARTLGGDAVPSLALPGGARFDQSAYVARVHGGVQLSRGWAALVELEYTDVTFDMDGREVDGTEVSSFASLRYTLEINSPLRPYAKAGVGYARSLEGDRNDTYGAKVAVGAQFDLSEAVSLYGEGQYVEYFSPDYSIIGVGMRSDAVSYGVHAGAEFRF